MSNKQRPLEFGFDRLRTMLKDDVVLRNTFTPRNAVESIVQKCIFDYNANTVAAIREVMPDNEVIKALDTTDIASAIGVVKREHAYGYREQYPDGWAMMLKEIQSEESGQVELELNVEEEKIPSKNQELAQKIRTAIDNLNRLVMEIRQQGIDARAKAGHSKNGLYSITYDDLNPELLA